MLMSSSSISTTLVKTYIPLCYSATRATSLLPPPLSHMKPQLRAKPSYYTPTFSTSRMASSYGSFNTPPEVPRPPAVDPPSPPNELPRIDPTPEVIEPPGFPEIDPRTPEPYGPTIPGPGFPVPPVPSPPKPEIPLTPPKPEIPLTPTDVMPTMPPTPDVVPPVPPEVIPPQPPDVRPPPAM